MFHSAMTSTSSVLEAMVIAAYDFSNFAVIADIGGGHGRLLSSLLAAARCPRRAFRPPRDSRGRAARVDRARCRRPESTVDRRVVLRGAVADAYVMKNVIHDSAR